MPLFCTFKAQESLTKINFFFPKNDHNTGCGTVVMLISVGVTTQKKTQQLLAT